MTGQGHNVSLQKLSVDGTCEILYSFAAVCGARFAEPDTFPVFEGYFEVFGGGTRLAMRKTICAPDSSSLKPGSGVTEGLLD